MNKTKKQENAIIGIYKITNPKGKVYIGQSVNIMNRWLFYKWLQCKKQPKIYRSLKKYGYNNHIFEILEECSIELLNNRENFHKQNLINELGWEKALFISLYDGGGGPLSPETCNKISKAKTGHSCYTKDRNIKIGNTLRGKAKPVGFGNKISISNSGKTRTQNQKDNHKNNIMSKPVYQIDINSLEVINEFPSMREAGRQLNINYNGITEVISGRQKTSQGYIWKLKK